MLILMHKKMNYKKQALEPGRKYDLPEKFARMVVDAGYAKMMNPQPVKKVKVQKPLLKTRTEEPKEDTEKSDDDK